MWGSIHEDHDEEDEDDNVVFSLDPSDLSGMPGRRLGLGFWLDVRN